MMFETKDSGHRAEFTGGMVRDISDGKTRPDLCFDGPMFLRWAGLMTRGAVKYSPGNWLKASDEAAYRRYKESAARHFIQWYYGLDAEEDHAAAVFFNINGAEYVCEKIDGHADQ